MWPRSEDAVEQMDDPDCDDAALRRTYAAFRYVNPVVSGWRHTWRTRIRTLLSPALWPARAPQLLDVGCGGGDLALALAGWADQDRLPLKITGIDPDRRAIAVARAAAAASTRPAAGRVTFRVAAADDIDAGSFDLVISNHVLHHVADVPAFLAATAAALRPGAGLVLHSDLRRSRLSYAVFGVGMLPFFRDTFIRHDGLASIRRSHTAGEMRRIAPAGWSVVRQRPFRLLVLRHA